MVCKNHESKLLVVGNLQLAKPPSENLTPIRKSWFNRMAIIKDVNANSDLHVANCCF